MVSVPSVPLFQIFPKKRGGIGGAEKKGSFGAIGAVLRFLNDIFWKKVVKAKMKENLQIFIFSSCKNLDHFPELN